MKPAPDKAYKNLDFLNSPPARHIRILAEYEEPRQRFLSQGVRDTIVFFGSARAKDPEEASQQLADAQAAAEADPDDAGLASAVRRAESAVRLSVYYEQARALSAKLTRWSTYRDGHRRYTIATGAGPGIMEAANRGAADVENGRSIGLGISLPFEPGLNDHVTPELGFEFHYFFTRKLWFVYLMKAMVVFPGGFGTLDELFEVLTLIQTSKVKKKIPIVLFGCEFWDSVLSLDALVDAGVIGEADPGLLFRTDDVEEAYRYVVGALEEAEAQGRASYRPGEEKMP